MFNAHAKKMMLNAIFSLKNPGKDRARKTVVTEKEGVTLDNMQMIWGQDNPNTYVQSKEK